MVNQMSDNLQLSLDRYVPATTEVSSDNHFVESTGNPAFCHAAKPPNSAAVFSIPFVFSETAELADVCSFGQEQYVTINLSCGSSPV